jgi:hypothetical protein
VEALEDRTLPSTFTVVDLGDAGTGSGLQGDLRYAIDTANADSDPSNQIEFQAGLAGTITLTQGPLAISKDLEIDGPGPDVVTVSGNHQSGVVEITDDPDVQVVNLSGLTIADGTGVVVNGNLVGGGIYDDHAALTLSSCAITGNDLGGSGQGGGIYLAHGTLTLDSCAVSDNTAVGGGGIYNDSGSVTVNFSTIQDNTGWGIYSSGSFRVGPVTVSSSTIADNHPSSAGAGGGLAVGGPATITDSTVSGNTGAAGIQLAGIIANQTLVAISRSVITGNVTDFGSALSNGNATVLVDHTLVSGNSSLFGGGIYNMGRITLTDSIISDNAESGIVNYLQLTSSGCTISGNSRGGLQARNGDAQVVNSTFSGNSADQGGGILVQTNAFLELTSVTITGNAANGTGAAQGGGGLAVVGAGRAILRNTLIAGNVSATVGPDVNGNVLSLGYNLVGAADDSQGWGMRDLTGSSSAPLDPHLGPLQDNGGPTPTHALLAGSPAINRGDPALFLALDQRGTVRFHMGINPPVDIGAFDANAIHALRLVAPAEVTAGQPFTITVTVQDGSGNTASTFLGRIHFTSTDGSAVLPSDYTFSPADGGVATFTVSLSTSGSQDLLVNTVGTVRYQASATVLVDAGASPRTFPGASFFPVDLLEGETGAAHRLRRPFR